MKATLHFVLASLAFALSAVTGFGQESLTVNPSVVHLGTGNPNSFNHPMEFTVTFTNDPNDPNPLDHQFEITKYPPCNLIEWNPSVPYPTFWLGPNYGSSRVLKYDCIFPVIPGYFTGHVNIQDTGSPWLYTDAEYDGTVVSGIGVSDYVQFVTGVGVGPATFSPVTGSPIPPACPLVFCPIVYSARFFDFDGTGTTVASWTWKIELYHAKGTYLLPLPAPSFIGPTVSDLSIYSPFTLPPNYDWRRDANGNIFAAVSVIALDTDGFGHRAQTIVGVNYPPAKTSGTLVCGTGAPVANSAVTIAFSDSTGTLDSQTATTDAAGHFEMTLLCTGSSRSSETFTIGIPSCGINRVVPTNRCYGELGDVICPQCGPSGPNVVPLDTGYDHAMHSPYSAVPGTQDNYWVNVASYPTTVPAIAPAFVLPPPTGWLAPFPSSNWISARNVAASHPSTNVSNPAYTIFRKCFCLTPSYSNPAITFNARADDTLQVWFNSQVNVLLPPQFGSFNGPARPSLPSSPAWFHAGRNCIYALVEDTYGGLMGFDLEGTIQANGLASQPVFGVNGTSSCASATAFSRMSSESNEETKIVAGIVKIAEERRLSRTRQAR